MDSVFFGTQAEVLYLLLYGNIKMSLGPMADSFNWMRGYSQWKPITSSASRQTIINRCRGRSSRYFNTIPLGSTGV